MYNNQIHKVQTDTKISPIIMFFFFLFVFSVPFEILSNIQHFGLAKFTGFLFVGTTVLQPRICYRMPHKSLLYFFLFMIVYFISYVVNDPLKFGVISHQHSFLIYIRFTQYFQLFVLFWLSVNLMRDKTILNGTIYCLALATITFSLLRIFGIGVTEREALDFQRESMIGNDPNTYASILDVGLVSLIGLGYGRIIKNKKVRILVWMFTGLLALSVARSGSKTATVALVVGLLPYIFLSMGKLKSYRTKIVASLALLVAIYFIVTVDVSRARWKQTIYEGRTSMRKEINIAAWKVFLDYPVLGAGPRNNLLLVGEYLFGLKTIKDTHNMYLWLLSEVGIVGFIPFFIAIFICFRSAWQARNGPQGLLPIALLFCVLTINMAITWHTKKIFWIVLAYSAACRYHTGDATTKKSYSAPQLYI